MRPLVFISYQHADYMRARTLAKTVRWRLLGLARIFMSEPERLFELPVEELAERVTAAHAVVQLLPAQGETNWMAAERVLAESLQIPVVQRTDVTLASADRKMLWGSLLHTPPFAKYAYYLRLAVMSTADPTPPDVRVPRTLWYYTRWFFFLALALWLRSLTILAFSFWVEYEAHLRAEAEADEHYDLKSQWEQALERAFTRLAEYEPHLAKVRDEFEWVGMSSTPMDTFRPGRIFVGRLLFTFLIALALIVDVTIRLAVWLYHVWSP